MKNFDLTKKKISLLVSASVCAMMLSIAPAALAEETTPPPPPVCTANEHLNTATNQCVTCAADKIWEASSNTCKPRCGNNEVWNTATQICQVNVNNTDVVNAINNLRLDNSDVVGAIEQLRAAFQSSNQNDNATNSLIAAIIKLGNKIEALAVSAINLVNEMTYQYNPDLPATMQSNNALVKSNNEVKSPSEFGQQQANLTTQQNTKNSLAQIAYSISPPESNNALSSVADEYKKYMSNNSTDSLTLGIKASDSPFYLPQNQLFVPFLTAQQQKTLGMPNQDELEKNNRIFNFGNLITPTTYTDDQNMAASRFIQFSTKNFRAPTVGINFNKLRTVNADDLYKFVTSSDFQQYQLNTRSQIALRSMSETILQELVAERTPISKDFCIAPGKCNVSALEVQKYIATRRANSPQFYRDMSAATPATLLREILFVLVEMQKQGHQAHLDNERVMSALAAISLQNSDTAQIANQENATQLNSAIDALLERNLPADKVGDQGGKDYMPPSSDKGVDEAKKDMSPEDRKKADELDKDAKNAE